MANDISEFAKSNPASTRGIFGDLLGITELANGTQKVIFGIIPRTARSIEFRFETPTSDTSKIFNSKIWKYNTRFDVKFDGNFGLTMNRKSEVSDGSKSITYRLVENGDELLEIGGNEDLTMLLFRKSDLLYLRSRLQNFNIIEFDRLNVSAFLNPTLDFETKDALTALLKNTEIYKRMDYSLRVFEDEAFEGAEKNIDKDSIVVIYDKNNPIAFETAMILSDELRKQTGKRVLAYADSEQRRQFFLNYDIAISVKSADFNPVFLARKYLNKELNAEDVDNLQSKADLFEMRIFLCSPRRIINRKNIISKLEFAK
jgi:hypothetical protein